MSLVSGWFVVWKNIVVSTVADVNSIVLVKNELELVDTVSPVAMLFSVVFVFSVVMVFSVVAVFSIVTVFSVVIGTTVETKSSEVTEFSVVAIT